MPVFTQRSGGSPEEVARGSLALAVSGIEAEPGHQLKDSATRVCIMLSSVVLSKLTNVRMCHRSSPKRL